jgi:two-component system nitrogen regulation response regulator GlnG
MGETGAGKELVARTIHQASRRASGPFIAVDCGAIAESLIENEIFGHEKGAFTGATEPKIGKLEAANGGTLFLDEMANLPLGAQTKLLRVLEERSIYRLGGTKAIPVDFRLLTACNVNPEPLVNQGKFRADLFYRLSEFVLQLPPLRDRKEDIPHLAMRFLAQANGDLSKNIRGFSVEALTTLRAHRWPGNARELLHVVRTAALMADGDVIEASAFKLTASAEKPQAALEVRAGWKGVPLREIVKQRLAAVEREAILGALSAAGGNKAEAARMLQIDYKTLYIKDRASPAGSKNLDNLNTYAALFAR